MSAPTQTGATSTIRFNFNSTAFLLLPGVQIHRLQLCSCLSSYWVWCLHDLSAIENSRKQHSKGRDPHYGQWIGSRRKTVGARRSWRLENSPPIFRVSEAHGGYGFLEAWPCGAISALLYRISPPAPAGTAPLGLSIPRTSGSSLPGSVRFLSPPQAGLAPALRVNPIIDIQERMAHGKGPAHERWAEVYNLSHTGPLVIQDPREKRFDGGTPRRWRPVRDHGARCFTRCPRNCGNGRRQAGTRSGSWRRPLDYAKTLAYLMNQAGW